MTPVRGIIPWARPRSDPVTVTAPPLLPASRSTPRTVPLTAGPIAFTPRPIAKRTPSARTTAAEHALRRHASDVIPCGLLLGPQRSVHATAESRTSNSTTTWPIPAPRSASIARPPARPVLHAPIGTTARPHAPSPTSFLTRPHRTAPLPVTPHG